MWYNHLAANSIHDFKKFWTMPVAHFMGRRKYSKSSAYLFTIKQNLLKN